MKKLLFSVIITLVLAFPAYAATDNPLTGDPQARYIGAIMIVMAVAALVVVVIGVLSAKKKK